MIKKIVLSTSLLFSFLSQAHIENGTYEIKGNNTIRGSYTGQLQVDNNKIIRLIRFNDLKIETVWEGTLDQNLDEMIYNLKATSALTTYNTFTVSDQELQNPLNIKVHIEQNKAVFTAGRDGNYSETYLQTSAVNHSPLWTNLRVKLNARNDKRPLMVRLMQVFGMTKAINWYRDELKLKQSLLAKRPEFLNEEQWQIFDPTDFDFYRENPEFTRVTNKTLNPLSLADATMRKNAYGKTLEEKADFFDQQTANLNLNEAGLLELASVDENGNKLRSLPEGDSCLWTGMYIWSQVLRYEQTQDPQALENIKKGVNGLLTLIDITNNPTEFARTLIVSPASENMGPFFIQGTGAYSHLKWIANGNNDMSKGLVLGFGSVYKLLKQVDPQLLSRVASATKRLEGLKAFTDSGYNRGLAFGLKALYSEKLEMESLQKFKSGVDDLTTKLSYLFGIDSGVHWKSVVDMSGNHLSVSSTLGVLLLTKQYQDKFPKMIIDGFNIRAIENHYKKVLTKLDRDNRSGHRGFETIAAYAMSNNQDLKSDALEALWCLKEIPAPRLIGDGIVDLKRLSDWSPSSWPFEPWKALSGVNKLKAELNLAQFEQGAIGYPIFETMSWQTTYYWKENPYAVKYQGTSKNVSFSADYLIIYWMARSSGLISIND